MTEYVGISHTYVTLVKIQNPGDIQNLKMIMQDVEDFDSSYI